MKTPKSGDARIVLALRDMDIANPLGVLFVQHFHDILNKAVPANLIGLLNNNNGTSVASLVGADAELFDGEIRSPSVVTLHEGVIDEDITLMLIDPAIAKSGAKPNASRFA